MVSLTIRSSEQVSPTIKDAIRQMYMDNVLTIRCLRFRRTGVNKKLVAALQQQNIQHGYPEQTKRKITDSGDDVTGEPATKKGKY